MSQIKVDPAQLERDAGSIRSSAQKINASVEVVTQQILVRMGEANFSGMRANALRDRYIGMQETLENFQALLNAFAGKLEDAARDFRAADQT